MRAMSKAGIATATMACAALVAACAGETKQADSPGTCPEGTVLRGSDCVPPGDDSPPATSRRGKGDAEVSAETGGGGAAPSSGGYDREAVEAELKRAARQIKANCGKATGEDGDATGPWGKTTVSVILGRNGHVKGATVPAPYDGKPVAVCISHSFEKIQFPPYAGAEDVTVQWDVELVAPKK